MHLARAAAGAADHPPKVLKFDFLQIHTLTTWYATYVLCQQPWISIKDKARLLEYQGRSEMMFYVAIGCSGIRTEAYETIQSGTGPVTWRLGGCH